MVLYKVCLQQRNSADREEEKGPVAAKQKEREITEQKADTWKRLYLPEQ